MINNETTKSLTKSMNNSINMHRSVVVKLEALNEMYKPLIERGLDVNNGAGDIIHFIDNKVSELEYQLLLIEKNIERCKERLKQLATNEKGLKIIK